ncbi:hypothetical protein Ade02nite_52880 [Paractinoplanes deccanensis]|uniref:Uncharacterized protein n=1 Tax=Paractinoplanes deccanensis TaxID=113561 RepID=A0ABQ3Y9J2_9ACTN|nr:hypothetical protein [Actinoplanes deccanensis]GID76647.1 hypothetical protein Ade02nite_52880 [Actinoplanes deccanensis]
MAETPDQPDTTVRIVLGAAGTPAPDPDQTAVITSVDRDATTRLDVGDRTLRIPLGPDDQSETRMLPAPVITTGSPERTVTVDHRPEFALAGIAASVIGLLGLAFSGPLSVALLVAFVTLGPGAALLSAADVRNRLTSWALTVAGSLSVTTFVAVVPLWLRVWQPYAWLGLLAAASLIGSAVQLARLRHAWAPALTREDTAGASAVPFVTMAAGLALWIVALVRLQPGQVGLYGFTAALGVPFVIGAVLLLIGFAVELFGPARRAVLAAHLVIVPVIMQATVPLLDGTTEYAWTYKHIGVVDLIRDNGHLISGSDIYQQWPGFFAVVAMISHVSGVDAISFSAWSSLFFALLTSLIVAALLRQFTEDRRVIAVAVLLFQACMWVDIGYFSPQAFVFPLMLAFWLVVARWLIAPPVLTGEPRGRIGRLRRRLVNGMPPARETTARARLCASLAAAGIYGAITVSHQLTPVVMMIPVIILAVLGALRPRLLTAGLIVIAVAFIGPRMVSVASQYSLFSLDFLHNAGGNAQSWGTPEQEFSALVSRVLAIGLWLAALLTVFLTRKKAGRVLVPVVLGFAPMATLAGGNYGGEAIYRVFAFSLPFVGLLIGLLWAGKGRRGVPTMILSGLLMAALLLAGLQGLQGQLYVHQMRATDIEAANYFYARAETDSGLILVAPNFPTKLTGNYGSFNKGHVSVDISLVGDPLFTNTLSGARLPEIETYIRAMNYKTNYLVVSEAMDAYTDYFGTEPDNAMASLEKALRASPDWKVFYQGPGVAIFQLVGSSAAG